MKSFLLIFFFLSFVFSGVFAGTGTQTDPFTVAQAIAKKDGSAQTYWVKGFVVGEMSDFSNNRYFYELAPPFNGTSAYLIADSPDEINLSKCMPVQLGSERANTMNLDEFPHFWRKEVLVCGLLRDYFSMPGLKTLSSLEVLTSAPLVDLSKDWNFYEDMDAQYVPASTSSIFAGGVYTGETGDWQLYGATWGNSSNDSKWGKAAARLRLSESTGGNPGYLQMNFDKQEGVGVIRFWAGYYDNDNNGAVSISISKNSGQSWETAVASQFISKDWKEYQFTINQTGKVRVRIMKAETGTAGINIDNIRISSYRISSGTNHPEQDTFSYSLLPDGFQFHLSAPAQNLALYNLSGSQVWQSANQTGTLKLQAKQGIYLLKIDSRVHKIILK